MPAARARRSSAWAAPSSRTLSSPTGVKRPPDRRLHTNHYITPEFASHETHSLPDSCHRLDRLRTLVKGAWGSITVDTMKAVLADHEGDPGAICRHGEKGMHSICGYIADPARGLFHVRRGHGCLGTWRAYRV